MVVVLRAIILALVFKAKVLALVLVLRTKIMALVLPLLVLTMSLLTQQKIEHKCKFLKNIYDVAKYHKYTTCKQPDMWKHLSLRRQHREDCSV